MPVPQPVSQEPHTAPHDEIIGLVRELLASAPGGVSLDALANALRERGFSRPPGSPRLITRLRRIKQLDVSRTGTIRLVEDETFPGEPGTPSQLAHDVESAAPVADAVVAEAPNGMPADEAASAEPASIEPGEGTPATPEGAPRRRRRRGGRRRRGRRNGVAGAPVVAPESA